MKKFFKWGAIIVVALIVIGAFLSDDEDDVEVTEGDNAQEVSGETDEEGSDEEESSDDQEDVKTAGVGDKVTINDFSFTVNDVEETDEIHNGNEYIDPATTSGKFVILDVTVSNDRDEEVTIDSSFFKLITGDGATLEPSTDGDVFMNMSDEDDFFLQQVNPGLEKSGKVVFEVGADVEVSSSMLEAQTGFWGSEKVEIELN